MDVEMENVDIELDDFPYGDDDWGMYCYNGMDKEVIEKLLEYSDEWGDLVHICCYVNKDRHRFSDEVFDFDNVRLYIYYRQSRKELRREVEGDPVLSRAWCDGDSYSIDEERVKDLIENEKRTKEMLKKILALGEEFDEMIYKNEWV